MKTFFAVLLFFVNAGDAMYSKNCSHERTDRTKMECLTNMSKEKNISIKICTLTRTRAVHYCGKQHSLWGYPTILEFNGTVHLTKEECHSLAYRNSLLYTHRGKTFKRENLTSPVEIIVEGSWDKSTGQCNASSPISIYGKKYSSHIVIDVINIKLETKEFPLVEEAIIIDQYIVPASDQYFVGPNTTYIWSSSSERQNENVESFHSNTNTVQTKSDTFAKLSLEFQPSLVPDYSTLRFAVFQMVESTSIKIRNILMNKIVLFTLIIFLSFGVFLVVNIKSKRFGLITKLNSSSC